MIALAAAFLISTNAPAAEVVANCRSMIPAEAELKGRIVLRSRRGIRQSALQVTGFSRMATRASAGIHRGRSAIRSMASPAMEALSSAMREGFRSMKCERMSPALIAPREPAPRVRLVSNSRPGCAEPPLSCST